MIFWKINSIRFTATAFSKNLKVKNLQNIAKNYSIFVKINYIQNK